MKSPFVIKRHTKTEYVMLFKVVRTDKRSVTVKDQSGREMVLMKGDTLEFNIPRSTETTERPSYD